MRGLSDRKMQRALLQFFKLENYFEVRDALIQANRRKQANADHYLAVPTPATPGKGYRLGRASQRRQEKR